MFKLTGTLKVIMDTVQVSEKFSKREFVIHDSSSMYPQDISFQAAQDKCSMLDAFAEGEEVEVSFNLRGREWTSPKGEVKYFNTLDAWRIEKIGSSNTNSAANVTEKSSESKSQDADPENDDLPF